ncbi:unnamed protein product [Malus baccata var. baccata]
MEIPTRPSKALMENNNTHEEKSFLGKTDVEDNTVKSDGDHEEGTPMETTKDEMQSAKAEMVKVREENEKLKLLLSQISRDYQYLQMHIHGLLQNEEETKKCTDASSSSTARDFTHEQNIEEADDLVSLSLGRTSSSIDQPRKDGRSQLSSTNGKDDDDDDKMLHGAGLALELGCRSEPAAQSTDNSSGGPKEDDQTEIWPPSKTLKTTRSGEDEVSQQTHLKKARVSVRARCDAPTMNDGCQWRKYGQKIAKGNPCPRAYYRCTVSPSCPVRKQVQRNSKDMSILITTYEGSHNHPLSMSATAMASTTSAAASMLQSHSSTSQQGLFNSATAPISASTNLQGLNVSGTSTLSQNSRLPQQHFYFPNSSVSTNNSHPTITLDLTVPTPSHFGKFPLASGSSFSSNPRYPSTSFNFSSSLDHNNTLQLQSPWNSISHTASGYFNYGNYGNRINQVGSALNIGKQPIFQEHNKLYQSHVQNQNASPPPPPLHHPQMSTNSIATATKAITLNPNFQSALAAALTSFLGNGGTSSTTGIRENHKSGTIVESSPGLKLKLKAQEVKERCKLSSYDAYFETIQSRKKLPRALQEVLTNAFTKIPVSSFPAVPGGKDTSVGDVVKILSENNILSAPVKTPEAGASSDWRDRYLGLIDYSASILWVLESAELAAVAISATSATAAGVGAGAVGAVGALALGVTGPAAVAGLTAAAKGIAKDSPTAADELGQDFYNVILKDEPFQVRSILKSFRWSPFIPVATDSSMLTIMLLLSKYRLRNVPVIEPGQPTIKNYITQSGLVQGLERCRGRDWFDCIAAKPISDFGLPFMSSDEVISITSNDLILEAFKRTIDNKIGGVPVVEGPKKNIVGNLTVRDFISTIMTTSEIGKVMQPITCKPESTLGNLIESFASKSLHRIHVVAGEEGEVVGVITLRDVISCFIYEPPNHFDNYMGFAVKEMLNQ